MNIGLESEQMPELLRVLGRRRLAEFDTWSETPVGLGVLRAPLIVCAAGFPDENRDAARAYRRKVARSEIKRDPSFQSFAESVVGPCPAEPLAEASDDEWEAHLDRFMAWVEAVDTCLPEWRS